MQSPFFANTLFWATGENRGMKLAANSCKQVAFAAWVQVKPVGHLKQPN